MIIRQSLMFGTRTAMMLASPTPDTLFAGPGSAKPRLGPGHNGPVYDRAIYGQVMRVDSAIGPGARSSSRVVIVPWDYDSMCGEVPWGNSFVWRRPGARGLYTATLRDSAHWAGGLPTYDVFVPEGEPYTDNPGGLGALGNVRRDPPPLTPEEMFGVARNFRVVRDTFEERAALDALYRWAEDHPKLVARSPLNEALEMAGYFRWRIRDVVLPIRGTYRVTYSIGTDTVTLYARTEAKPNDFWDGMADFSLGAPRTKVVTDGYFVNGWNAPDTLNWLSANARTLDWGIAREPLVSNRTATTWKGFIYPDMLPHGLGTAEMIKAVEKMNYLLETFFTVTAKGGATFEHRSQLLDGRAVVVHGVRISRTVSPP